MFKRTITYDDYSGNRRTEDFYFHLSRAEIMEMDMGVAGGMVQLMERLMAEQDITKIVKIFKDIILKAYGVKSPDGRRFIKSPELAEEFSQTEAYSILFTELATDAKAAADFINGIVPNALSSASGSR